jgi:hypothetical protein
MWIIIEELKYDICKTDRIFWLPVENSSDKAIYLFYLKKGERKMLLSFFSMISYLLLRNVTNCNNTLLFLLRQWRTPIPPLKVGITLLSPLTTLLFPLILLSLSSLSETQTKSYFKCICIYSILNVLLDEDMNLCFILNTPMKVWTFVAKTKEERDSWVTDTRLAKNNLLVERGIFEDFDHKTFSHFISSF